ncbi:ypdB [Acrasis kona]|uniref:YpdB n=1 Tax=Acrasis kona TaxID=1008807 RepID=A0AAW2YTJ7_9EUKA
MVNDLYTPTDLDFSSFTVSDEALDECMASVPSSPLASPEQIFSLLNDIVCGSTNEEKTCINTSATLKESFDLAIHGTEFLVELPPLESCDISEYFECSNLDQDIVIEPFYAPSTKKIVRRRASSESEVSFTLYERRRQKIRSEKPNGIAKQHKM